MSRRYWKTTGDSRSVKELVESGEIGVNEPGAQNRTAIHRFAKQTLLIHTRAREVGAALRYSLMPILTRLVRSKDDQSDGSRRFMLDVTLRGRPVHTLTNAQLQSVQRLWRQNSDR